MLDLISKVIQFINNNSITLAVSLLILSGLILIILKFIKKNILVRATLIGSIFFSFGIGLVSNIFAIKNLNISNSRNLFFSSVTKDLKCNSSFLNLSNQAQLLLFLESEISNSYDIHKVIDYISLEAYSNPEYCSKIIKKGIFNEKFLQNSVLNNSEKEEFAGILRNRIKDICTNNLDYSDHSFNKSFNSIFIENLITRIRWNVAKDKQTKFLANLKNLKNLNEDDLCDVAKETLTTISLLPPNEGELIFSSLVRQEVFEGKY